MPPTGWAGRRPPSRSLFRRPVMPARSWGVDVSALDSGLAVAVERSGSLMSEDAAYGPCSHQRVLACHPDRMAKLTEDDYKATVALQPIRVDPDEETPFDFWPYFEAIPPEDFCGHDFSAGAVPYAWRMPESIYEHVLVRCDTPNVFLVLVLDVISHSVVGHHLLDLNRLYGPA